MDKPEAAGSYDFYWYFCIMCTMDHRICSATLKGNMQTQKCKGHSDIKTYSRMNLLQRHLQPDVAAQCTIRLLQYVPHNTNLWPNRCTWWKGLKPTRWEQKGGNWKGATSPKRFVPVLHVLILSRFPNICWEQCWPWCSSSSSSRSWAHGHRWINLGQWAFGWPHGPSWYKWLCGAGHPQHPWRQTPNWAAGALGHSSWPVPEWSTTEIGLGRSNHIQTPSHTATLQHYNYRTDTAKYNSVLLHFLQTITITNISKSPTRKANSLANAIHQVYHTRSCNYISPL